MPVPMMQSSSIRPIFEYLERAGVHPPARSREARRLLLEPGNLLPTVLVGDLLEDAARAAGIEVLGVLAAQESQFGDMNGWRFALNGASTLGSALALVSQIAPRLNTADCFWVTRRGNQIALQHHLARSITAGRAIGSDYALVRLLQLVRLADPDWLPDEIWIERSRPPHAALLESLATRVRFGQPSSAVLFPVEMLGMRLALPRPPARGAQETSPAVDFPGSMRQLVAAILEMGAPNLESAARSAHLSKRTLQRRLRAAGMEFGELLEAARFAKAQRLLRESHVRITEIGTELGYTDAGNFTRAFRRWSGLAPQEYRRREAQRAS